MEIERKFLVKRGPALDPASGTDLSQGYLAVADGAEVRVRSDGARHVLTVKRGQGLVRAEVEVVLDDDEFERLWPLTEGRRIVKRRTVVDVDGTAVEVDVYAGALAGLVVAEAEFATVEDSRRFVPPAWMGDEVTGRPEYANAAEPVKRDETSSHSDLMTASQDGSLIQATVGSLGGVGRRWRKRAGLAA